MAKKKVTPFLMFDDRLEAAMTFYLATFPETKVKRVMRDGKNGPVRAAELVIGGQAFMAYNGGPHFKFTDAFSLFVECEDQREVDRYWKKLLAAGATPIQCGWIRDPFGLSWQIIPKQFIALTGDKDPKKVQAVMAAMMKMVKLDVKGLEKAYRSA
jgi:predicted 3-demethylubiquinone-9 3-methyltransferase (glyoxalase superfamily)